MLVAAAMEYVDYRRYADYLRPAGSDVIDGARGRSRRGLHQAQVQEEEKESPVAAPIGPKRLPVWWLFFLPLYWFPQSINFGLIQTYLLCVSLAPIHRTAWACGTARQPGLMSVCLTTGSAA